MEQLQKIRQISRQILYCSLVGIVFRIDKVTLVGDVCFVSFFKILSAEKHKILKIYSVKKRVILDILSKNNLNHVISPLCGSGFSFGICQFASCTNRTASPQ